MVSVYNIRPITNETDKGVGNESYLRPPVFIVGTHADKPAKDVKEMIQYVQENLTGKAYQEHVIRPLFSVDNNKSQNDEGVQALREKILEVLKQEPYMGEELPIRYGAKTNHMTLLRQSDMGYPSLCRVTIVSSLFFPLAHKLFGRRKLKRCLFFVSAVPFL